LQDNAKKIEVHLRSLNSIESNCVGEAIVASRNGQDLRPGGTTEETIWNPERRA
jgi:hypothetical protein